MPLCSLLSPLLPGLGSAAWPSGPPNTGLAPRPLPPQTQGRILLQELELCSSRPSERPLLAVCSFSGSDPRSAGPTCLLCVTSSCRLRLVPRPTPPHMRAAPSQPFPDALMVGAGGDGTVASPQTFWSVALQTLCQGLRCTHTSVLCV